MSKSKMEIAKMSKTVKTRVDDLERRIGNSDAIGVRWDDSRIVTVQHTGEELELDAFWSKYPGATLIHVVHKDTPPDIKIEVNWDDIEDG